MRPIKKTWKIKYSVVFNPLRKCRHLDRWAWPERIDNQRFLLSCSRTSNFVRDFLKSYGVRSVHSIVNFTTECLLRMVSAEISQSSVFSSTQRRFLLPGQPGSYPEQGSACRERPLMEPSQALYILASWNLNPVNYGVFCTIADIVEGSIHSICFSETGALTARLIRLPCKLYGLATDRPGSSRSKEIRSSRESFVIISPHRPLYKTQIEK